MMGGGGPSSQWNSTSLKGTELDAPAKSEISKHGTLTAARPKDSSLPSSDSICEKHPEQQKPTDTEKAGQWSARLWMGR